MLPNFRPKEFADFQDHSDLQHSPPYFSPHFSAVPDSPLRHLPAQLSPAPYPAVGQHGEAPVSADFFSNGEAPVPAIPPPIDQSTGGISPLGDGNGHYSNGLHTSNGGDVTGDSSGDSPRVRTLTATGEGVLVEAPWPLLNHQALPSSLATTIPSAISLATAPCLTAALQHPPTLLGAFPDEDRFCQNGPVFPRVRSPENTFPGQDFSSPIPDFSAPFLSPVAAAGMPAADTGEMTSVSTKMPQPKPTNRAAQMVDDTDSEDGSEEGESLQFKVILVGDGAVGKTSLATRFCEEVFVGKT